MEGASRGGVLLCAGALALAGCGGGGGGSGSDVRFSFQSASSSLAEDAAPLAVTVVLSTPVPELVEDVTVEVYDLGTGTATAGSDYAAFVPTPVTFAKGWGDGASVVVRLQPLEDDFVEAPVETVVLGLRAPRGGVLAGATRLRIELSDADAALVSFATEAGAAGEGSAGAVALELDCGAGVTLQVDASVRVSDSRNGTAEPLADYEPFPGETITFPAGSTDGAVRSASLALVQDASAEVLETIELALSHPSPSCVLGAVQRHVLRIEDDDLAPVAAFQASAGATGTENALAYDERIDLGTDAVAGGPNAGTCLRIANLGGTPLNLWPPYLNGIQRNDFAIELESSSPVAPLVSSGAGGFFGFIAAAEAFAPFHALPRDSGPGLRLHVEQAELARMARRQGAARVELVLPELGPATLVLARRPLPLAPDAKLFVDGREVEGGPRTLLGDLQLWSGTVAGEDGSLVFLAFDRDRVEGFVHLSEPGSGPIHVFADGPGLVRLVGEAELQALGAEPPGAFCASERLLPPSGRSTFVPSDPDESTTLPLTISGCRLALETDYQLFEKLGSSSERVAGYVTSQFAAISELYEREVQTSLAIAYLGIHTSANDGWDSQETEGATQIDLLYEFQAAWVFGSWPVQADLAHFLSGTLGGGVAFLGALCSQEDAFGVSSGLYGNIDWPAWNGASARFVWDFHVVAHELGHNFGSPHTHDFCPPLDECAPSQYWGACQDETRCERGTIMSYCSVGCSGGLLNIDLRFHPATANMMRVGVNPCLPRAALGPGEFLQYRVRFNPLFSTGARNAYVSFDHDASNVARPFRLLLSGMAE